MTTIEKQQAANLAVLIETLDEQRDGYLVPESILYLGLETVGVTLAQFRGLVGAMLGAGVAERADRTESRLRITAKGREVAARIREARGE